MIIRNHQHHIATGAGAEVSCVGSFPVLGFEIPRIHGESPDILCSNTTKNPTEPFFTKCDAPAAKSWRKISYVQLEKSKEMNHKPSQTITGCWFKLIILYIYIFIYFFFLITNHHY